MQVETRDIGVVSYWKFLYRKKNTNKTLSAFARKWKSRGSTTNAFPVNSKRIKSLVSTRLYKHASHRFNSFLWLHCRRHMFVWLGTSEKRIRPEEMRAHLLIYSNYLPVNHKCLRYALYRKQRSWLGDCCVFTVTTIRRLRSHSCFKTVIENNLVWKSELGKGRKKDLKKPPIIGSSIKLHVAYTCRRRWDNRGWISGLPGARPWGQVLDHVRTGAFQQMYDQWPGDRIQPWLNLELSSSVLLNFWQTHRLSNQMKVPIYF